jgi:hypothetical protein
LGNNITPLFPVARGGPAIAGDLNDNFRILNQDAQAIIKQLLGTENDAATLFNLFASTQNNLRQTVRERIYTSGSRRYVEEFISNTKLGASTAAVDFNAGVVSLPLVSETFVKPDSIDFGVACVGALGEGTTDLLLDGLTETSMTWTGSRLELVFNFNTVQILNRFRIDLAGYQGLVVEEFSTSPGASALGAGINWINTRYRVAFPGGMAPKRNSRFISDMRSPPSRILTDLDHRICWV